MPRVAIHTFGCKINQYESEGIGESLTRSGLIPVGEDSRAEIHIINTCTVTSPSDLQCRQLIRRVARENPGARVVVTGCYAQRDPEGIARIPGVSLVLGHGEKGRIAEHVARLLDGAADGSWIAPPVATMTTFDETPVSRFLLRTRATVKVQDGCDKRCGFCIIPSVRGASRSRAASDVLDEIRRLIDSGHLEIVLSGIHLGSWRDEATGGRLDALVEGILDLPGLRRLRLSSLEPQHLTDRLLDLVASPLLMPFFHLPLQSGDNAVLRRMRRGYNTAQFAARLARLVARRPDAGIGSDILVGYPGEDDASFERSFRFIAEMPFTHLHVFSFSPRPGTEAAALDGAVGAEEKRARNARVRALAQTRARAFRARFHGARAEILVESKRTRTGGLAGFTGNYIRAELPWSPEHVNRIVAATLHPAHDGVETLIAIPEAA